MLRWPGFQKHAEDFTFGQHGDAVEFSAVDHELIARTRREKACLRIRASGSGPADQGECGGCAPDAAYASVGPTPIDVTTDPDAKPPISFYAGHYPEPFGWTRI